MTEGATGVTLFCSDIDGTLLDRSRSISARTAAAIRSALGAGHLFVLCSSRMPDSMRILQAAYGGRDSAMIAYNGALVLGPSSIRLEETRIGAQDATTIYEKCLRLDLHASFYIDDNWYPWADDKWTDREVANTRVLPHNGSIHSVLESSSFSEIEPHKIMCMGDPETIDDLLASLQEIPALGVSSYRSKDTYVEFASTDCSKGSALVRLANYLSVPISKTVFFGDNYNDLSALEVAGTGIAVANARDEVIEQADDVTGPSFEDGVAIYLESVLEHA